MALSGCSASVWPLTERVPGRSVAMGLQRGDEDRHCRYGSCGSWKRNLPVCILCHPTSRSTAAQISKREISLKDNKWSGALNISHRLGWRLEAYNLDLWPGLFGIKSIGVLIESKKL